MSGAALDRAPTVNRRRRFDLMTKGPLEVTLPIRVARPPFRAGRRSRRSIRAIRTTNADPMHGDD